MSEEEQELQRHLNTITRLISNKALPAKVIPAINELGVAYEQYHEGLGLKERIEAAGKDCGIGRWRTQ